jgi:hypothetical protein
VAELALKWRGDQLNGNEQLHATAGRMPLPAARVSAPGAAAACRRWPLAPAIAMERTEARGAMAQYDKHEAPRVVSPTFVVSGRV